MIPRSLTLRNFLSYGPDPQTLSFDGLAVACLHGPNGAGKSALFDAITWAVWGKARTRSYDDLVRRGADEAAVSFSFELPGGVYRVARTYARRGGKHAAALYRADDGAAPGEELEAKGVDNVKDAISDLIKLPYESFVASVYLKQGEAGFFAKALSPRGRKDVFFGLLGLERFLSLGAAAARAGKVGADEAARVEATAAAWAAEVVRFPALREELAAAEADFREAEKRAASAGRDLAAARRAEADLALRLAAHAEKVSRLDRTEGELASAEGRAEAAEREIAMLTVTLSARDEILTSWREFEDVRRRLRGLEEKGDEWERLEGRRRELNAAAVDRRRATEKELAVLDERQRARAEAITSLEDVVASLPAIAKAIEELNAQESRLAALRKAASEYKVWERRVHETRAAYARAEAAACADGDALRRALARWDGLDEQEARARKELAAARAGRDDLYNEMGQLERAEKESAELGTRLAAAAREAELTHARVEDIRARLADVAGGVAACPTCGRTFDTASAATARGHLAEEIAREEKSAATAEDKAARLRQRLEADRVRLTSRVELRARLATVEGDLARAGAAVNKAEAARRERDAGRAELLAAESKIRNLGVSPEGLAVAEAEKQLAAVGFDAGLLRDVEEGVERLRAARYRHEEITRAREKLAAAYRERDAATAAAAALETRSAGGFLSSDEKEALASAEDALAELAFDPAALAAARRRRDELGDAEARLRGLRVAEDRASAAAEVRRQAASEIEDLTAEIAALKEGIKAAADVEAGRAETEARLNETAAAAAAAEEESKRAAERLGGARAEIKRMEEFSAKLAEAEAALPPLRRRLAVDRYLAEAFGPDGIPTLIMERALGELEAEADGTLALLTDGRMALRLETQRPTKAGGLAETLDVILLEKGVPRPYESFSGGEAFRADFALRLGLSRLLARRAGVPLRFLVVDEGFGTQDEEGMAALVDVIGRVRAHFDKILVISHLPEMRDAFPQRVEVFRAADGFSRFRNAA